MTDPIADTLLADTLLADAAARADLLRLRLTGALEAMRTALAVMVVEPETNLARWRLKSQITLASRALEATKAETLEASKRSEAA
jgi:hypothetical protein